MSNETREALSRLRKEFVRHYNTADDTGDMTSRRAWFRAINMVDQELNRDG